MKNEEKIQASMQQSFNSAALMLVFCIAAFIPTFNAFPLFSNLEIILVSISCVLLARVRDSLLDPVVWFPAIFTLVNLTIGNFVFDNFSDLIWFESYRIPFQEKYHLLYIANTIALIGFYLGNGLYYFSLKRKSIGRKQVNYYNMKVLKIRCKVALYASILMLFATIQISGGLNVWLNSYGNDQFNYSGIGYFLRQLYQIVWYGSFSLLTYIYFKEGKSFMTVLRKTVIVLSLFVAPQILWGDRSGLLYAMIIFIANYALVKLYTTKVLNIKSITYLICATISFLFLFSTSREIEFNNFKDYVLYIGTNFNATSSVVLTTINYFPNEYDFLYGSTYISSFLNLVPNFFFGGNRPFENPSLIFQNMFANGVTNMGFGFSILAEAYMNGGLVAVFMFFFVFSYLLTLIILNTSKNIGKESLKSIIVFQTIWFIRGDSTVFFKVLLYTIVFVKLLTLGTTFRGINKSV